MMASTPTRSFAAKFLLLAKRLILGPMSLSSPPSLTTLFVPPNSCFTDAYWYLFTSGQTPEVAGPGAASYLGLPWSTNCLPTNWAASSYFSPGICPGGYTIACSSFNIVETVTETVATCCPRYRDMIIC